MARGPGEQPSTRAAGAQGVRGRWAGRSVPGQRSDVSHSWDVTPSEAIAIQKRLAPLVERKNRFGEIKLIAGVDAGFPKETARAAVAVLSYPELQVVETAVAEIPVAFPYVPGLLSFREAPAVLAAFEKLTAKPDLLIVDGQGLAHRRRFGIACHLGLLLDIPTIGSAKSLLVGRHADLPTAAGSTVDLVDKDEVIGAVVRTRANVKPVYVSIGHRIDLPTAVDFILNTTRRYRLPEPQRAAHTAASGYARKKAA